MLKKTIAIVLLLTTSQIFGQSAPRKQPASRTKAALWGALIGFGAAFPIGAASAGHLMDRNNPGARYRAAMGTGFGIYGAGIGAAVGALTGGKKMAVSNPTGGRP